MRSSSWIIVGALVMLAACGVDDSSESRSTVQAEPDPPSATSATSGTDAAASTVDQSAASETATFGIGSLEPENAAVATSLVDVHGGELGFVALVSALERGGTVALMDRVRVVACAGDSSSLSPL
jgi:hypothetical protein